MNDVIRLVLNIASKNKIKRLNIEYHKTFEYGNKYIIVIGRNFVFNYRDLKQLYKYSYSPQEFISSIKKRLFNVKLPKNY